MDKENKILVFAENASLDNDDITSDFDYNLDPIRIGGNPRGMAKRAPNNKALKQGTLMAASLAQYISEGEHGFDVNDQQAPEVISANLASKLHGVIVDEIALSDLIVHTSEDEEIDGVKSFTSFPVKTGSGSVALTPTQAGELSTKQYVDDVATQAGTLTKEYIDAQDAITLSGSKAYADEKVGSLDLLETVEKSNVVSAINEVNGIVRFKVIQSETEVKLDKPVIYFLEQGV